MTYQHPLIVLLIVYTNSMRIPCLKIALHLDFTGMKKPMITTIRTLSIVFIQKKAKDSSVLGRTFWVRTLIHCKT